jgi:Putative Flp pilus-assembly TadE/G-like
MSKLHQVGTSLRRKAAHFVLDRDASIPLLFGLALVPMMAGVGAAVDYSRASDARTQLQNAADSTVLAIAKRSPVLTDAQIRSEAEIYFRSTLKGRHDLSALPLTITRTDKKLAIAASGFLPTSFSKLFGVSRMNVATLAEANIAQRKVELALALDNTGSMNDFGKMDELKKATKNLIAAAELAAPAGSGMIKIALVPYTTQVRLNTTALGAPSWLAAKEDAASSVFDDIRPNMAERIRWTGCLTDRGPGFDTNDKRVDVTRPDSFYPAMNCDRDPRRPQLAQVQPLTDNWNALRNTVDRMSADGCTNVTIGARFGLAALAPSGAGPVGGGVAYGTADVDKYLIILTDGLNTKNRFTNACGGGGSATSIDDKTKTMCDEIKAKSSRRDARGNSIPDVKVFTVRVIEGNKTLLTNCATNASMYKEVNNAAGIDAVFKDILREITRLQLTM